MAKSWKLRSFFLILANLVAGTQTRQPWVRAGRTIPVYAHRAIPGGRPHSFLCAVAGDAVEEGDGVVGALAIVILG